MGTSRAALRPLAAGLLLALFALDAWAVTSGWTHRVDQAALVWLRDPVDVRNLRVPGWTVWAAIAITEIGGAWLRTPIVLLATIALWWRGRRREAIVFLGAVASAAAAEPLLKLLFSRARPDLVWRLVQARHESFPSGHAMGAAITFPLLGHLLGGKAWLWAGIALAAAIGLSRVFLGVHWLSDVVGGWLLGGAWALAATVFLAKNLPTKLPVRFE